MRAHRSLLTFLVLALAACATEEEESLGVETSPITPSPPFYGDPAKGAVFAVDVSHWEGPLAERELDCFWDSGVRHLIAGTQVEEVTRQQLAVAVARGLTVDAYVYLYWDRDLVAQVKEAFKRSSGFPIGRLWLDVEENPRGLGANPLGDLVQQAIDTCQAEAKGGVECGIYTGPGFWKTYLLNTTRFAGQVPLWYAWYNAKKTLDAWSSEAFGGWALPTGKQWAEQPLCGVGVDKNTIQVSAKPTVVVDRSLPPDDGLPPPAPTRLYPVEGSVIAIDMVKLMTSTIPRAQRTQLALERWDGNAFRSWYTWSVSDPFLRTYPKRSSLYRFRARAQNAHGWGPWSDWSSFDYGSYTGSRPTPGQPTAPSPTPSTPPPTPPPSSPPAPSTGTVPTGLAPDGATLSSSSVTLSCTPLSGASRYELAIESRLASGQYTPYVTYTTTGPSKIFYPQIHKTRYRFRVRAELGGVFGSWSGFAAFDYN